MKQTALDWLRQELEYLREFEEFYTKRYQQFDELFNKAKEIEKEQIIEAHGNKQKTRSNPNSIVTYGYTYTGEMYYNEKFKGIKPII